MVLGSGLAGAEPRGAEAVGPAVGAGEAELGGSAGGSVRVRLEVVAEQVVATSAIDAMVPSSTIDRNTEVLRALPRLGRAEIDTPRA